MKRIRSSEPLRRAGWTILAAILACVILPAGGGAVSRFSVERESGRTPAAIDFDDIWFTDQDRSKRIPDLSPEWLVAVFDPRNMDAPSPLFAGDAAPGQVFVKRGREIAERHGEIADVHYDPNLAEDAFFFSLREGLRETVLRGLIRGLNDEDSIAYTHPALRIDGKAVAYFNAFRMNWKTGVEDAAKERLMAQAHVFFDPVEAIYRVDVLSIPFFKAINLLAEDIRVSEVTPYLVPLETSIRVDLSVPLKGCQLGDRIPFSLRIDFSDRVRLDPSSLVNINLRPEGIQRELYDLTFEPYDYVKASSRSPVTLAGWMRIYSPGEFVLPVVEIHYECPTCSGERVRSIRTRPIPIRVASLVPARAGKAELVVPMDEVRPDLPTEELRRESGKALRQGLGCLVLAAALLGVWGRRRHAAKKERQGELAERREDVLAERLRAYLTPAPTGAHWVYAGDAGRLLREYLGAKFGLAGNARQGTGEVFFEGAKGHLPRMVAARLWPLLKEIDRMIAVEAVEYPELERWKSDTLGLLDLAQSVEP